MFSSNKKNIRRRKNDPYETSFARQLFHGFVRIVGIVLLITAVWYVTRLEAFSIRTVTVEGGETITHDEVLSRVEEELKGSYMLLVPKRFTYLYPSLRIQEVLEKIPSMQSVSMVRVGRKALHISFEEYIPHALWCPYTSALPEPCYFINAQGYAFVPAPLLTGGTFVRHRREGIDEINIGMTIDSTRMHSVDDFIMRIGEEFKFRVTSVVHRKTDDIELTSNGGGRILISGNKDFQETYENLKSVLRAPEFEHIAPGNFQYIDVRFDNKVFVNEEPEPRATTSATTTVNLSE